MGSEVAEAGSEATSVVASAAAVRVAQGAEATEAVAKAVEEGAAAAVEKGAEAVDATAAAANGVAEAAAEAAVAAAAEAENGVASWEAVEGTVEMMADTDCLQGLAAASAIGADAEVGWVAPVGAEAATVEMAARVVRLGWEVAEERLAGALEAAEFWE